MQPTIPHSHLQSFKRTLDDTKTISTNHWDPLSVFHPTNHWLGTAFSLHPTNQPKHDLCHLLGKVDQIIRTWKVNFDPKRWAKWSKKKSHTPHVLFLKMLHHITYLHTFKNFKNHWHLWKKHKHLWQCVFFFGSKLLALYPFIITVTYPSLGDVCLVFGSPSPRNSETTHTGHTSTYHAAQTSQGIAIRLWGKLLEAYPWGDGLWKDLRCEKKKVDWCVFF